MTDRTDTAIRRRPDGSIDTAFYIDRGRRARSKSALDFFGRHAAPAPRRRFGLLSFVF